MKEHEDKKKYKYMQILKLCLFFPIKKELWGTLTLQSKTTK
jgi:hypothetical protein